MDSHDQETQKQERIFEEQPVKIAGIEMRQSQVLKTSQSQQNIALHKVTRGKFQNCVLSSFVAPTTLLYASGWRRLNYSQTFNK